MNKYYWGYVELQKKKKRKIDWGEVIGSILFAMLMILITIGISVL